MQRRPGSELGTSDARAVQQSPRSNQLLDPTGDTCIGIVVRCLAVVAERGQARTTASQCGIGHGSVACRHLGAREVVLGAGEDEGEVDGEVDHETGREENEERRQYQDWGGEKKIVR